jgi:DNA-binding NarL/FixJ family response regulator
MLAGVALRRQWTSVRSPAVVKPASATTAGRYDAQVTRIVIADDHPLFRRALMQAVREIVPGATLAEAADLDAARADLAAQPDTDLLLLDLHMPGSHGLVGLAAVRAEFPAVAVAMVSAHDDPGTIRRAIDHGAAGFISKSADLEELKRAIACVLDCRTYVPPARADRLPAHGPPGDRELAVRLASLTPQQFRPGPGRRGPAQQADRRRLGRAGAHGQGAPDVDLRAPRGAQPHAGRRDATFAGAERPGTGRGRGLTSRLAAAAVTGPPELGSASAATARRDRAQPGPQSVRIMHLRE